MTIKQAGGVFGRHPTFSNVDVQDDLVVDGTVSVSPFPSYPNGSNSNNVGSIQLGLSSQVSGRKIGTGLYSTSNVNWVGDPGYLNVNNAARVSTTASSVLFQADDILKFYNASGGTAGSAITWNPRFEVDGFGNFKLNTGNLVMGTSGKGIDFSATAGTGTSELFSDYEEGTWTPVPADAETGGNTGTAGTATGYYTKVGNVVHVMGALVNVSTSGLTAGNLFYIQGLPFASKDLAGATAYYLSGGALTSSVSITGNVQFYLNDLSKTSVTFFDAGGSILVSDLTSGAADFYFSLTYMAA